MVICTIEWASKKALNEKYWRDKLKVCFSSLYKDKLEKYFVLDNYFSRDVVFTVFGFNIIVQVELAKRLKKLSEHQRSIILCKYFLGLTDKQIGDLYNISRATI